MSTSIASVPRTTFVPGTYRIPPSGFSDFSAFTSITAFIDVSGATDWPGGSTCRVTMTVGGINAFDSGLMSGPIAAGPPWDMGPSNSRGFQGSAFVTVVIAGGSIRAAVSVVGD